jgi:outer membrane protein OmpA-like peptidoglycan-associated protein
MPSSSAVVLALAAVLGLGAASALAQSAGSRVVVYPTQGAASSSSRTVVPGGALPAPPPGPIESRIVALPDGTIPALPAAASAAPAAVTSAPMGQPVYVAPPVTWGGGTSVAAAAPPSAPPAAAVAPPVVPAVPGQGEPLAVIPFTFRSAILNAAAKAELDRVARTVKDKGLRQLEIRAFATGGDIESRKVALARALVVRSYLIDQRLKARIEVGSFNGEGEHVEIVVPGS